MNNPAYSVIVATVAIALPTIFVSWTARQRRGRQVGASKPTPVQPLLPAAGLLPFHFHTGNPPGQFECIRHLGESTASSPASSEGEPTVRRASLRRSARSCRGLTQPGGPPAVRIPENPRPTPVTPLPREPFARHGDDCL